MSNTNSSAMLVAACFLALSCITVTADFSCQVPRNFVVKISDQSTAIITEAELNVKIQLITFNVYPGNNSLEIQANSVILNFTGYLNLEIGNRIVPTQTSKISQLYYERLYGTSRESTAKFTDRTSHDCRVVLQPVGPVGPITSLSHPGITSEIRRLAESCLYREICTKIDTFRYRNDKDLSSKRETNFPTVNNWNSYNTSMATWISNKGRTVVRQCDNTALQETINTFVDIGINQLVENIGYLSRANSVYHLPDVDYKIPYGPRLQLFRGTFRDLRTLHRRSDACVSHDGDMFIAALDVGLDKIIITYNNYKVTYGISASGTLSGTTSDVGLSTRVSVDYTQNTCLIRIQKLRVTKFGTMNFHFTGLGYPLNWMLSTITRAATRILRTFVVYAIEKNVRKLIQSKLSELDCEQFRVSVTRT